MHNIGMFQNVSSVKFLYLLLIVEQRLIKEKENQYMKQMIKICYRNYYI